RATDVRDALERYRRLEDQAAGLGRRDAVRHAGGPRRVRNERRGVLLRNGAIGGGNLQHGGCDEGQQGEFRCHYRLRKGPRAAQANMSRDSIERPCSVVIAVTSYRNRRERSSVLTVKRSPERARGRSSRPRPDAE